MEVTSDSVAMLNIQLFRTDDSLTNELHNLKEPQFSLDMMTASKRIHEINNWLQKYIYSLVFEES